MSSTVIKPAVSVSFHWFNNGVSADAKQTTDQRDYVIAPNTLDNKEVVVEAQTMPEE